MTISKYQKFGLRREKNLSDVVNKKEALSSLLDDFTSPKGQLDADDILVISGLQDTRVTNGKLLQLNDLVRKFLPTNAETGAAQALQTAIPLETINDKIENLKVVLGDPPFSTGGGDGLQAIFYKIENIVDEVELTSTSTGDDVFKAEFPNPNGVIGPVDFWNTGRWRFGATIHPDFDDEYGLVQWEGFYSGNESFFCETTGLYMIEYNFEDGSGWQILKSSYASTRTLTCASATGTVTSFDLDPGQGRNVNRNDTASAGGTSAVVTDISGDTITVDSAISVTQDQPVEFTYSVGNNIVNSDTIRFPYQFFGGKLRVRFTVWFPQSENLLSDKRFDLEVVSNNIANFPFTYFYSDFDSSAIPGRETFEHFRENSLSARNTTVDKEFTSRGLFKLDFAPIIQTNSLAAAPFHEGQIMRPVNTYPGTIKRVGASLMQMDGEATGVLRSLNSGAWANHYDFIDEGWWLIKTSPTNGQDVWIADQVLEKLNANNQFYLHNDSPFLSLPNDTLFTSNVSGEEWACVNNKDVVAIARGSTDANGVITFEPIAGPRVPDFYKNLLYRKDYLVHIMPSNGFAGVEQGSNIRAPYPKRVKFVNLNADDPNNPTGPKVNIIELQNRPEAGARDGEIVAIDPWDVPVSTDNLLLVFTVSAGLEESGRIQFCKGTYGKIATLPAAVGATRIYVNDTTGINADPSTGDWVQFGHNPAKVALINEDVPGTIVPDTKFTSQYMQPSTYVTAIGSDANGPYIDINNSIGNALTSYNGIPSGSSYPALDLPQSATLVFIPRVPQGDPITDADGNFIAREFCVMPLDTAPPFEGTDDGLRTPTAYQNLKVQTLKFTDLEIYNHTNATALTPGQTYTANNSLEFTNQWFVDDGAGNFTQTTKRFKFLIA